MNLIKWTQQTKLAGCIFPTIELFHIWASRWMVETLRLGILIMTQESRRWKMMKVPSRNDEVSQVTSPLNVSVWVFMFVLAPPLCWFVRVPVLYISHAVKILYIYVFYLPFLILHVYITYTSYLEAYRSAGTIKVLPSQLLRTLLSPRLGRVERYQVISLECQSQQWFG